MGNKDFSQVILEKAASLYKHIALPEGEDIRTIEAAKKIADMKMAKLTLFGDEKKMSDELKKMGAKTNDITIINPKTSPKLKEYAEKFYQLRKNKGVTQEQALEIVKDEVYFATMMVKTDEVDGLVSGAVHSTPDTVRPALQIIKAAKGVATVSSMFFMTKGDTTLLYADSGLNQDPTAEQLADIALTTARTAKQFGFAAKIAMLSYSTKGSAKGTGPDKMIKAAGLAKEKLAKEFDGEYAIDGELQFDAAFVPSVAAKKAPGSPLKGQANVFIFPDLGVGNICYKMTERLAGYNAYGPILQGIAKPVNDLSRGCNSDDIVAAVAITAIQSV
ncbi:MAG: phosphate acetyltransferase [Planctomycetes bacterium GWF2_41_51]|nr:MAG: phosphate acetyltransferase [Planctomycetes bacterium GWF2_41_51]HBG28920.1 phosphate acetyltransferase [Phycisphaerales bacterium]